MKVSLVSPFDLDNPAEVFVRYCPECATVGEPTGLRDCCPDGNRAFRVPLSDAAERRNAFIQRIKDHYAALASQSVVNPDVGA